MLAVYGMLKLLQDKPFHNLPLLRKNKFKRMYKAATEIWFPYEKLQFKKTKRVIPRKSTFIKPQ